jgi:hypothetical protein
LLDRAGAYDEAFQHFQEGNRRRREQFLQEGQGFDRAAHSELVDRLLRVFTADYFERVRGFGSDSEVPVFVTGMPRSGTSLVEQILSHHPEAAGLGELRDIPKMVTDLPARLQTAEKYPECLAYLDQAAVQGLGQAYLNRIQQLAGSARRVSDKMLENFLHLGLIATLFPRARIIHCRRDPLDTCVSCYLQFFHGLDFTWDLADLGSYYRDYQRLMAHWQTVLPMPILDINYEDLVADVEDQSRRLLTFCGLDWNDRCLRFYENPRAVRTVSKLQVRRPIYTSSVGRWRHYAAHLGPLQEALRD